ncbi:uncharacterized protein ARMOST_06269 [Armillaria ostoyae]|uniref:Uncharacterized protein n=1 Tax=Armillaria ostoyae TaxID=47428 RepID=A0A284R2K2_ARMOS|nr:uncharacterized protein ARMOST_06269 [Armillaria ostoyae]
MLCSVWSSRYDHALIENATRIGPLQELETRIAKETGTIDSVEVFQETLSRRNAQSVPALKTLNTLFELRLEFPVKQRALRYRVKREWRFITSVTAPAASTPPDFGLSSLALMRTYSLHCVPDALFMEEYLTKDLSVPTGRIQCLTDTRAHIYPSDACIPSPVNIIRTSFTLQIPINFDGQRKLHPPDFRGATTTATKSATG